MATCRQFLVPVGKKQMSPTETGKCVNSHPPIRPRPLLLFLRSLCCQNCVLQWPPRQYLRNHANGCWWRRFVQKRRKSAEIGSERDLSKQTSESKLQSTNPVLHESSNNAKKKIIVTSKSKKTYRTRPILLSGNSTDAWNHSNHILKQGG